MPAAVETSGRLAAFASREVPAWHALGTVFEGNLNTQEMLALAHLNGWNVRLVPFEAVLDFDTYAKPQFLVVRDNPFGDGQGVLGTVGSRYNVVQNEQLFDFGDLILDGGGRWETAGSIKGGTQVFGSLAFDEKTITLDPDGRSDEVKTFLLVVTGHDGSCAVTAIVTPVRVVCANTLAVALGGAKSKFTIRHTSTVDGKIAAARKALGVTFGYMDAFQAEAQAMIEMEITKATFDDLVTSLYPMPEKDAKGSVKKWTTKIDQIEAIYLGQADGPDTTSAIRGTVWGAYNALTENLDWYGKIRAGNVESLTLGAAGLDIAKAAEKERIHSRVMALL